MHVCNLTARKVYFFISIKIILWWLQNFHFIFRKWWLQNFHIYLEKTCLSGVMLLMFQCCIDFWILNRTPCSWDNLHFVSLPCIARKMTKEKLSFPCHIIQYANRCKCKNKNDKNKNKWCQTEGIRRHAVLATSSKPWHSEEGRGRWGGNYALSQCIFVTICRATHLLQSNFLIILQMPDTIRTKAMYNSFF